MSRRIAAAALVVAVVAVVALALVWTRGSAHEEPRPAAIGPTRHVGPQGRTGQFVAHCRYSHGATDDPIVHFGHPGRSHRHDFYGAVGAGASATADELATQETTCDKPADTAAYWHPTLYDGDQVVVPNGLAAYYRAAPGVTPTDVEPFPFGMAMIAGDATATAPQRGEAAGWVCGVSTNLGVSPPACPPGAPLHMLLTFPDCWDGHNLDSDDHTSHVAYSAKGECPATHPVHVPQLTVSVAFPISGRDHDLRLASGSVYSVHGDFLNAWNAAGLQREIKACIHRDAVCDLVSNRGEEAPFFSE